jgi:predicted transcriptional regulator
MDVKATKLQFIERYLKISDETIIKKLYQTLNEEVSKKKRLPLTEEENEAINKGMEDIKNGHTLSGEQVRAKIKMKYPGLIR